MKKIAVFLFVGLMSVFSIAQNSTTHVTPRMRREQARSRLDPLRLDRECKANYVESNNQLIPVLGMTEGMVYSAVDTAPGRHGLGRVTTIQINGSPQRVFLEAGTKLPCERFLGNELASHTNRTCELFESGDGSLRVRLFDGPSPVISYRYRLVSFTEGVTTENTVTDTELRRIQYTPDVAPSPTPNLGEQPLSAVRPPFYPLPGFPAPTLTNTENLPSIEVEFPAGRNPRHMVDLRGIDMDRWQLVTIPQGNAAPNPATDPVYLIPSRAIVENGSVLLQPLSAPPPAQPVSSSLVTTSQPNAQPRILNGGFNTLDNCSS